MASNRITRGGAVPRALPPVLAVLAIAALLTGCGGGSSSTGGAVTAGSTEAAVSTAPEESPDAPILNTVLSRQEAVVDAFAATIPRLPPRLARMASFFRAQEQEHVDGVVKAMRGLGIPTEPKAETIDPGEPKSGRERLVFLYEVESTTVDEELSAISKLESSAARSLLGATVANQAQHLSLLRRALGAGALASIPEPFENGTAEPPE